MTLQFSFSYAINSIVKNLTDAGIHVVVVAGNLEMNACDVSPAAAPSEIMVGATGFFLVIRSLTFQVSDLVLTFSHLVEVSAGKRVRQLYHFC